MTCSQNAEAAQPPTDGRSSLDQQFKERRRIAERLVEALREAGYSCRPADEGHMRALKREN
jgi:hypothetical protein